MQHMNQSGPGSSMMMGSDTVDTTGMGGAQSLDDIVNQNAKMIRRQSLPQPYGGANNGMDEQLRRVSTMMEFSGAGSPTGPLDSFQFDPSAALGQEGMMNAQGQMSHSTSSTHGRRSAGGNLSLNTSFAAGGPPYSAMVPSGSNYRSPAHPNTALDMDISSPFMQSAMGMSMDYGNDPNFAMMSTGTPPMNMYNQSQYHTPMMNSPMNASMTSSFRGPSQDPGNSGQDLRRPYELSKGRNSSESTQQAPSRQHSMGLHEPSPSGGQNQHSQQTPSQNQQDCGQQHNHRFTAQPQNPQSGSHQDKGVGRENNSNNNGSGNNNNGSGSSNSGGGNNNNNNNGSGNNNSVMNRGFNPDNYTPNNQGFDWEAPEGGWPSSMVGRPHTATEYKNAYSSTGFDMLSVLMRVATRPNPEINIGAVDLSCAFVVCDAEKDDFPIVYCSENFERLTGYTKHMILGRNCRFLQSPDGNVEPGIRRKYVDDDSVLYLKNMINLRREAQISLINYRRGGQPFMNLLTMIPITWDTDQTKFFVGFQVDLVEQPNAVTDRNPDGSYAINYQRGMTMPRYVMNAPESTSKENLGQTVPRDDVSAILSTIGSGESEYAKRMWDKVLLENTDDVVHVLSLKGLFQWVSPSALRVLEYEPGELIGTALSSVCHPSDIVPVTRELKDTASGGSVNVVFRIRRKNSGYMWFEGHGSLHTEQGKGRKSIIMVGRERPVYTISKNDIMVNGGIGENELWTKMSTSGMFLFVSSNVRQLLDRQPDELIGVSIQSMMRADSKTEFARILELARTGKKASAKHEMINRRGQVLQAFTTLYPGDATEGMKPTFVVAQTRLIKYPRGGQASRNNVVPIIERKSSESVHSNAGNDSLRQPGSSTVGGNTTPRSGLSTSRFVSTDGAAATYAGQNGLPIGRQDVSLASDDNIFDELKTTKSSSWQYEIRQLEKRNRMLAEEVQSLLAAKKKRKRRKGNPMQKDCANCHTRVTPEWRRGPSGQRDLCNSCGLRWAKLNGRVSPRTSSQHSVHSATSDKASKASASPRNPPHAPSGIKSETPQISISSTAATVGQDGNAFSPQQRESYAAHMEGAGGVPEKIDEDIEPD